MSDRRIIKTELEELNSPLLENLSRMPYAVPSGYFEGLPEQVLKKIHRLEVQEELLTLSPTLAGLQKDIPYATPAGYFEHSVPVSLKPKGRVVTLFQRSWMRYAAAAAVLVGGIFFWTYQDNKPTLSADNVLIEVEKDIKQLNEKQELQVQEFISAGVQEEELSTNDQHAISSDGLLAGVSEEELTEFLEQSEFIITAETNN
ncbi:MAG: hypothetical protein FJX92_00480 [Bacteroidetes bacterium]|nr:hypothetical protein [Bacteroidota bacterium]